MYQIKGELIKKYNLDVKSESFRKQDIVIDTGGEYPQQIKLQCTNQLTDISNRLEIGRVYTLHFSLRGKEWGDTHITNIHCYKIEGQMASNEKEPVPMAQAPSHEAGEDLPF